MKDVATMKVELKKLIDIAAGRVQNATEAFAKFRENH